MQTVPHSSPSLTDRKVDGEKVAPLQTVDFVVRPEGSIWLFTPQSPNALSFLAEFISEDAIYWGPSLVCEHRYVYDLLVGLRHHGLTTERA
jgi:hypothetical protein